MVAVPAGPPAPAGAPDLPQPHRAGLRPEGSLAPNCFLISAQALRGDGGPGPAAHSATGRGAWRGGGGDFGGHSGCPHPRPGRRSFWGSVAGLSTCRESPGVGEASSACAGGPLFPGKEAPSHVQSRGHMGWRAPHTSFSPGSCSLVAAHTPAQSPPPALRMPPGPGPGWLCRPASLRGHGEQTQRSPAAACRPLAWGAR